MSDVEVGQILWLKIRFNNNGLISTCNHPYLVLDVDPVLNCLEIAQVDSLEGKEYKAALRSNKIIFSDEPNETVIYKDSYAQLDNTIKIENFDNLSKYRKTTDKLSQEKLDDVISSYYNYHKNHEIDEMKQVYMDKKEIEYLN